MNNISGANNISDILEDLGYNLVDCGNYYKCAALFRNGDNSGAITIYKDGLIIDHVESKRYNYNQFLALALNIKNEDELGKYLEENNLNFVPKNDLVEPLIKSPKYKNKDFINKLNKSDGAQQYWINRGISLDVLKELGGGLYKNKYYFPIFDKDDNNLLGWSARILDSNGDKKYIIAGEKKNFLYFNKGLMDIENLKKVYIHEGIADCASAMSVGVRNNLVQFGVEISFTIVNFLLKIPDIQIFLCQNNDDAGRNSCIKNKKKLRKYFDFSQVHIKEVHSPYKDLNDMLQDSPEILKKWFDK